MNNLTNHDSSKSKSKPKDESVTKPSPALLQTHRLHTQNQPSQESEAEIIARMVEYMKEFLEKPHQVFHGLPICPFAQKLV